MKGFMREGALLQTIHFASLLVDPANTTGKNTDLGCEYIFVCFFLGVLFYHTFILRKRSAPDDALGVWRRFLTRARIKEV